MAVVALVADHYTDLPEWLGSACALVIGGTVTFAAWRWLRPGTHPTLQRNLLVGLLALVTVAGSVLAWSDAGPRADGRKDRADAKNVSAREIAQGITVTRIGDNVPGADAELTVDACLEMSGTGRVPEGWGLWLANNRDPAGTPGVGGFWSLQRARQTDGGTTWHIDTFGVGEEAGDTGNEFWLYVFLVPAPSDAVLSSLLADAPGVQTRPAGSEPVAQYRVKRDAVLNCPWFERNKKRS
ncbi:hypothetical protein JCM4814A_72770 [Streptomyces phaeofaciens JCM 4814]|uniref:Uncharacterized protein n=1 Tax=Streptomyces phaeofaciens TaxID=68254 RepID=A0A918HH04_9ACTN|nr:hypothetical protein GCM10010226_45230 [Streptomyces phaeofaciens]